MLTNEPYCKVLPSFFLLLNTKEDILNDVCNQSVDEPHWLPYFFFHTKKSMGAINTVKNKKTKHDL